MGKIKLIVCHNGEEIRDLMHMKLSHHLSCPSVKLLQITDVATELVANVLGKKIIEKNELGLPYHPAPELTIGEAIAKTQEGVASIVSKETWIKMNINHLESHHNSLAVSSDQYVLQNLEEFEKYCEIMHVISRFQVLETDRPVVDYIICSNPTDIDETFSHLAMWIYK